MSDPFSENAAHANSFDNVAPAHRPPEPSSGTPAVWIIIALNIAVFIGMVATGESLTAPTIRSLIKWGANSGPLTMTAEPWRLFSCMFVHIGIVHIGLNMYVLGVFGPSVERAFGTGRFVLLYILSGLGGSILSVCWNPNLVSAGASGAIFGIVGGVLAFYLLQRETMVAEMFQAQLRSLLAFIGYNLFYGFVNAHIDNSAHIGGLVSGFFCGVALTPNFGARHNWGLRESIGTFVLIAALGGGAFFGRLRATSSSVSAPALTWSMKEATAGGLHMNYSADFETAMAERVVNKLFSMGFGKSAATALLLKENGRVVVGIVVKDGAWSEPKYQDDFKKIGERLSREIFDSQPLDLRLYDKNMTPQKTIPISAPAGV